MESVKLQSFEGPLDLLLSLLTEQKLAITDVHLSDVTEQYLTYLDSLEETNPEELADFLVVATKLLLLKSRMLLPHFAPEEEEDGPGLEEQLRLYKLFIDASKKLNTMWLSEQWSVFRIEPVRKSPDFVPPENTTTSALHERMKALVHRLAPKKALPTSRIDKAISMKSRIDKFRLMLKSKSNFTFHETLDNATNKTEVIVGFLALLELVKQKSVHLSQDDTFSDILVTRV